MDNQNVVFLLELQVSSDYSFQSWMANRAPLIGYQFNLTLCSRKHNHRDNISGFRRKGNTHIGCVSYLILIGLTQREIVNNSE